MKMLAECGDSVEKSFRDGLADLKHRQAGNISSLDALRSLAILLVFSAHSAGEFRASPSVARFPFFYLGWTGVDLFFVLSGFLIGSQLWKEITRTQTIRLRDFILRRGLRIWPLYFCFVGLVALEDIANHRQLAVWADVFCVSNYFHHQVGGAWSLSSEEQFYLIAPVLILVLSTYVLAAKYMWLLPASWLAVVPLVRAVMLHSGAADGDIRLYTPLYSHSEGLAVGLLLAWISVFHRRVFHSTLFRINASASMLLCAFCLYIVNRSAFKFASLALIFGAMMLLSLAAHAQRVLRWHGFYILSRLSYGVYLNHFELQPLIWSAVSHWRTVKGEPAFWVLYILCFAASMGIAFLTFQLIEWPFLALRTRIFHRQTPARSEKLPSATGILTVSPQTNPAA